MKIYANQLGEIVRVLQSDKEQGMFGEPPAYTEMLDLDLETNPRILSILNDGAEGGQGALRLSGGKLYQGGVEIVPNADGPRYADRKAVLTLVQGLRAYNALSSPTNAQSVAAIKANNRLTLVMARLLLREIRD